MKKRLKKKIINALFPKNQLEKESIQRLTYKRNSKEIDFSYKDKADFLKRCCIKPESFLNKN